MNVQEWLGKDNKLGQDIWNKKYRYNNESFDEWLDRVSGGDKELKQLILDKKFLFGGRTLSNRGTDKKGSFSNCYSRGFVNDSLDDLMQASKDIAVTFKAQGGQGISLSKLRPKGCGINGGQFVSDGIVPFMEIYNTTTESISQGGCISENELVQTENGYKKIKDIKVGDKVWTKKGFIQVIDKFDKGYQDVYQTITNKGYKIKTTLDHKFSYNGFDKKPLKKFNIGENILLIAGNHKKEIEIFDYQSYFIGAFLANGYINQNKNGGNICISNKHIDIAERIKMCINKMGFESHITSNQNENAVRIYLNNNLCDYIANDLKIYKIDAYDLSIPDYIMEGNDDTVLSFIAGAIDNDGHVRKTSFKYNTVCKQYAEQFMLLLSRVGFFPSLHHYARKNKAIIYEIVESFRLDQPQLPSLKVTKTNIKYATNSRYTTPYTIENSDVMISDNSHLKKISRKSQIGLYTYTRINRDLKYTPMIYDSIKEITLIGKEHVYDIELEEEHLFNCNGFYVSNSRKGALIMTLDAWHKEADTFIKIKSSEGKIQKANLSLEIDDKFMECVKKYYETGEVITKTINRNYEGNIIEYEVTPIKLYKLMMETAYDWAEPGCLFVNRFRNYNLMEYVDCYNIENCNPCGEQPLPKHGACNLGSINLSEFVINPFTSKAHFDTESFVIAVKIAIRALDTVLDENMKNHPLKEQQEMARNFRNVGLGLMGMHDMFIKLGYTYGDKQSIEFADSLADLMFRTAVIESSELAEKKGAFPKYDSRVLSSEIIRKHFTVDELDTLGIKKHGLRNCSLLSVAPAGSIGTMLNISTGCEPLFALYYNRKTDSLNGKETYYKVYTGIAKEYIDKHGDKLPEYFNTSKNIKWKDRINMQAALQKHIDTAISSTINLPYEITQEEIEQLYLYAWEKGLKGITIFRDGCKRVGILSTENTKKDKKNNKIVSKNETKSPKIANETEISSELKRGMIIKADDNCIGKKRTLQTGCGTLHCEAFFDPDTGDLLETYLSKGSKGGCLNSLTGLSRLISLSARAGVDIYSIVDQLKSSGTCPSYAVRTATKHDTSTGSSCPVAVGNALLNMYKELQEELFEDTDEKVQNNVEIEKRGKRTEIKPIDEVSNLKTIIPCPECGQPLRFEGGCNTCPECGFSKCD